jgi:hypothetical protein
MLACSLVLAGVVAASPAHADSWTGGCTGIAGGTCVGATTGGKNTSNHTQWVGWVQAYGYGGEAGVTKLEVWGDGFYFATGMNPNQSNPVSPLWGAQRWVRSGTYVCGAATFSWGGRDVACIAIHV